MLEIMLAMLVLGVVVSMVSLSLSGSIRAVEATLDKGDLYYRAQVAFDRISDDLASAVLPADVEFIATGSGDVATELSFASLAHIVFDEENGQSGMAVISYAVIADKEDEQQLLLVRTDELYRPTGETAGAKAKGNGQGFLLCDRLRSVSFSFVDHTGEEQGRWDTTVEDSKDANTRRLPAAVNCRLEFWLNREDDTSISFETTVSLPVGIIQAESELVAGHGA